MVSNKLSCMHTSWTCLVSCVCRFITEAFHHEYGGGQEKKNVLEGKLFYMIPLSFVCCLWLCFTLTPSCRHDLYSITGRLPCLLSYKNRCASILRSLLWRISWHLIKWPSECSHGTELQRSLNSGLGITAGLGTWLHRPWGSIPKAEFSLSPQLKDLFQEHVPE